MIEVAEICGKRIWPPFTMPSGVITVQTDIIKRIARDIPMGLITTKSIGRVPFQGYAEPVISHYSKGGISSAIGLSTMGYKAWIEEIKDIYPIPDRFLLVSIFGETIEDFLEVAPAVAEYADGIELNFCCPHSLKYGEAVAKQGDLTVEITKEVRKVVSKPLVVKLTPNIEDIGAWAKALVDVGADAIAAIGPTTAVSYIDDYAKVPVLSFGSGGLSGPDILQSALNSVRAVAAAVDVPIIGGGGIATADDVRAFQQAGASIFSIGTSLAGKDTDAIKYYFENLLLTLQDKHASDQPTVDFDRLHLAHRPMRINSVERQGDINIIRFDENLDCRCGQFVFAWVPQVGEKPLSIASGSPLTLAVRAVGKVTSAICSLQVGDHLLIRGPFGKPFDLHDNAILVGGGVGIVPLRFLAESIKNPTIILGAARAEQLIFAEEFTRFGKTILATDDGSVGIKGTAVDALQDYLEKNDIKNPVFYNCGPEKMMLAACQVQQKMTAKQNIHLCVERHTCCGVGLCGKCALDGYRTCVDGPTLTLNMLEPDTAFGRYHRLPSGLRSDRQNAQESTCNPTLICNG